MSGQSIRHGGAARGGVPGVLGTYFGTLCLKGADGYAFVSADGNGVIRVETSKLVVDVDGSDVTVHYRETPSQAEAACPSNSNVHSGSVDTVSFSPDPRIIRAGSVPLNKISLHLSDMPDDATGQLLVAPEDLAGIDLSQKWSASWVGSIQKIRKIKGYHGLDGADIRDCCEALDGVTYEENLASYIRQAYEQACLSGQPVTTGLFMPTKQMMHGRNPRESNKVITSSLYSYRKMIAQQGERMIHDDVYEKDRYYWTCTLDPSNPFQVYSVDFNDGSAVQFLKDGVYVSARPVALTIEPS
ncbi:MAG: hypothetical protein ACLFU1_00020 [Alphaproteobacteria bacterium]